MRGSSYNRPMPGQRRKTNEPASRPTLRDVAALAGVSTMTASRVVAGKPGVSPRLVRQVEDAIRTTGYARNEAARLMRPGQKSGILGVIVTNIENPYYAQLLHGIERTAQESGHLILTGISHGDVDVEARLVRDLAARQVEGLIIVPAGAEVEHLSTEARGELPLVLASRGLRDAEADSVIVNDFHGVKAVVKRQIDDGMTRIGFVGNDESVSTAQRRFEGFKAAMEARGLQVDPTLVVRRNIGDPDLIADIQRILEPEMSVDAVVTSNNMYSLEFIQQALALGADERDHQPLLIGFDDFELAKYVPYPTLIIDHDAFQLGVRATSLLFEHIAAGDEEWSPQIVTMPVKEIDYRH